MQINTQLQEFTDVNETYYVSNSTLEQAKEEFNIVTKVIEDGQIVARGSKEDLKRLQDDLRKAGYKKIYHK